MAPAARELHARILRGRHCGSTAVGFASPEDCLHEKRKAAQSRAEGERRQVLGWPGPMWSCAQVNELFGRFALGDVRHLGERVPQSRASRRCRQSVGMAGASSGLKTWVPEVAKSKADEGHRSGPDAHAARIDPAFGIARDHESASLPAAAERATSTCPAAPGRHPSWKYQGRLGPRGRRREVL